MSAPRPLLIAVFASWLLTAPLAAHAAPADDAAMLHITTLDLQADAEVKVEPDQASIGFGVQTEGATAAEAMRENRTRMAAGVAALKAAGVEGEDIKTSSIGLNAQYAYAPSQPPKLTGYQASNQVTIVVHDLARLGPTIDAVTAAGINQVNSVDFGLADPKGAEDEARRRAIRTLAARAQLYAGAAGMKVGRLLTLTEGGGYQPPVLRRVGFAAARAKAADAPTPVEPGRLTVRIGVSATYELTN